VAPRGLQEQASAQPTTCTLELAHAFYIFQFSQTADACALLVVRCVSPPKCRSLLLLALPTIRGCFVVGSSTVLLVSWLVATELQGC
jgi:hypothetical protein